MRNQVFRTKLYSPCKTLPNILSFALDSSPPDYPMYLALTTSVLQSSTYISCILYSLLSTSHTPHLLTPHYHTPRPCDIALLTTVCCIPRPTSPAFYILWTPSLFLLRFFIIASPYLAKTTTVFCSPRPTSPIFYILRSPPPVLFTSTTPPQSSTYISCW